MDDLTFSREELYDLVWSESLLSLSKKYNISDVGLRKTCIRMSIPLPKAGHWAKLQAGKSSPIEKLSSNYTGEQKVIFSLRGEGQEDIGSQSPFTALQQEIENDSRLSLIVPSKLSTNPDILIQSAKESLSNKNTNYRYIGVINTTGNNLDIRVSPENVGRSLRFMDTFIKVLRARGHDLKIVPDATYAIVDREEIQISFREKLKKVIIKDRWDRTEYHASGILSFKIEGYYGREWKDGKDPVEHNMSKILAKLEIESKRKKDERQHWQNIREEQKEKERIQREIEQRKEKELTDFKQLLQQAHLWRQATMLRSYIDSVEAKAITDNTISEEVSAWTVWARAKADWYDPNIEGEDDLLKEVDKETLTFKKKSGFF